MSMPDDFNELEQVLGELSTRQPSPMLDERIAATLREAAGGSARPQGSQHRVRAWAWAAALLLAFSVVVIVLLALSRGQADIRPVAEDGPSDRLALTPRPEQADTASPTIQPVNLTWSRDTNDQLRYTPAGKPYRAVVRQTIDQRVWIDPDSGATMQTTTPREELYIIEQPVY